jgi:hypothetical protein
VVCPGVRTFCYVPVACFFWIGQFFVFLFARIIWVFDPFVQVFYGHFFARLLDFLKLYVVPPAPVAVVCGHEGPDAGRTAVVGLVFVVGLLREISLSWVFVAVAVVQARFARQFPVPAGARVIGQGNPTIYSRAHSEASFFPPYVPPFLLLAVVGGQKLPDALAAAPRGELIGRLRLFRRFWLGHTIVYFFAIFF